MFITQSHHGGCRRYNWGDTNGGYWGLGLVVKWLEISLLLGQNRVNRTTLSIATLTELYQ
jgi:hypothetical protein